MPMSTITKLADVLDKILDNVTAAMQEDGEGSNQCERVRNVDPTVFQVTHATAGRDLMSDDGIQNIPNVTLQRSCTNANRF